MTRTLLVALFCRSLNCSLTAQDKLAVTPTKVHIDIKQLHKPQAAQKDAAGNTNSLSAFDAFSNVVVQPGQSVALTSTADWTGADHVSIAIECPTTTSLQNTAIAIQWAVPLSNAPYYTATDVIFGKNLLLANMGGAVVASYGNLLQLLVINNGTTSITCDQVTIYAVVH
jgi:hypothetical protein